MGEAQQHSIFADSETIFIDRKIWGSYSTIWYNINLDTNTNIFDFSVSVGLEQVRTRVKNLRNFNYVLLEILSTYFPITKTCLRFLKY